jgi:hypothetical protein
MVTVIQPELKHLLSADVPDMQAFRPPDEAFALSVQAIVGPRGQRGEESFGFRICSPKWIEHNCAEPMLGVHFLIVPSYNYDQIMRFVSKIVTACAAETWQECALKLQRLGTWSLRAITRPLIGSAA